MENFKLTTLDDANGDIDARWYVSYSFLNPETNKYQRFKISISQRHKTKTAKYRKAEQLKKEIDTKLLKGWNPFEDDQPNLITTDKAFKLFLKVSEKTLRKRTMQTYSSFITRISLWANKERIQNIPISHFSYHHAQKFMDYLIMNQEINNRTYNNYVSTYRIVFNFFEKREFILKNPFMKVDFLREDEGKIVAFTDNEWKIIYNKLPEEDPQLWIIANLIYYACLRPAEIMRLKFENIDMNRQKIYSLACNSKNRKQQVIEISSLLHPILSTMKWDLPQDYYIFSKNLLPGKVENYPTRIAERWRKFADRNGIKDKTIYNLKHNAAGRLIDAGFNPRDIQLHLRHSSLEQTEIYIEKFRNVSSERLKNDFPPFV